MTFYKKRVSATSCYEKKNAFENYLFTLFIFLTP